jgi:tetratricopeptide (TPR) repeat protein
MKNLFHVLLLCLLVCACQSEGKRDLSESEKKRLIEVHTETAQQYLNMGELDRAEGQVEKGLELAEKDPRLLNILGKVLLKRDQQQDVFRAEKVYRWLDENHPDFQVSVGLGNAFERQGVLYRESAERIESGKQITAAADPAARAAELRTNARQRFQDALSRFERSLEQRPDNVDGLSGCVRTQAHLGDRPASLKSAQRLIEVIQADRKFWETSLTRPELSADEEARFRKLARAQSEIEIATRLHVSSLEFELKHPSQAIAQLDGIVALKPDLAEAYSRRAEARMSLGEYKEAQADLENFLRLSPGRKFEDPDIRKAYALLDECARKLRATRP